MPSFLSAPLELLSFSIVLIILPPTDGKRFRPFFLLCPVKPVRSLPSCRSKVQVRNLCKRISREEEAKGKLKDSRFGAVARRVHVSWAAARDGEPSGAEREMISNDND